MLLYSQWLSLPINVRHKIASDFKIQKKTPTHVQDNIIVSDGYNLHDVENALTVEALQNYLHVGEKDLNILWNMLINPVHESNVVTDVPIINLVPKKSGRPKGSKNKQDEK